MRKLISVSNQPPKTDTVYSVNENIGPVTNADFISAAKYLPIFFAALYMSSSLQFRILYATIP